MGMRKYRRRDKRKAYEMYVHEVERIKADLKNGRISQEEFNRHHELLDEKFNWVR
jgi:hypothetical protein